MTKLWGSRRGATPFVCPGRAARVPLFRDMTKIRITRMVRTSRGEVPGFNRVHDRTQDGSRGVAALFVGRDPDLRPRLLGLMDRLANRGENLPLAADDTRRVEQAFVLALEGQLGQRVLRTHRQDHAVVQRDIRDRQNG